VRARIARGQLDEAEGALAALHEVVVLVGTRALCAAADLAEGALEAVRGDHRAACRHLEDAVDAFELLRAPFEASVARIELAAGLAAAGDHEASVTCWSSPAGEHREPSVTERCPSTASSWSTTNGE
jgi:hypothetical protein